MALGVVLLAAVVLDAGVLQARTRKPTATPRATPTCTAAPCELPSCPPGEAARCEPCGCDCRCAPPSATPTNRPTTTPPPTFTPIPCAGDCDGNHEVTIDELVRGVAVALGSAPPAMCASYAGCVVPGCIQQLVEAVARSLEGCPAAPTTATPTATPMPCGEPATIQRYAECRQARDAEACAAAGGRWGLFPYSRQPGCFCRTGQEGCPCTGPDDCLGRCFDTTTFSDCSQLSIGFCSGEEPQAGCWCQFWEPGQATGFCNDP